MHQIPIERFQWPLGFSILFLALEPLVGERRRRRVLEAEPEKRWPKLALLRRRVVVTLMMAAATAVAQSANASPRDAERAYHAGKFKQSADEYGRALARAPNDVKLQYNLGVAAYKSGEYAKAGDALGRSLHADRLDLQENAYYDLGNVLFRVGQETVAKQPEQTTEKWKKSIASYESALKLNPKDQDAIYNRDLVKRKLAALEQQQQKQKDEQKKKEDKSGQQNKQNQAGKQGQQDQQAKNEQGKQDQKDQQAKNEQGKQDQQKQQGQQNKQNEKGQPENQQASAQPQQGTGQPKPAAAKPEQQAPGAASAGDESEKDQKEPEVPGKLSKNDAKELLDAVRGDEKIMPMVPIGPNRPAADDVVRKDW
jgi:Ca-activated chloride channel family protein